MMEGGGSIALALLGLVFAMAIPLLVLAVRTISGTHKKFSTEIELPADPYRPTKDDDIEGYRTSDISVEWFVSSIRDSGVWYDPVLNVYGPYSVRAGIDLGAFQCPYVVALAAYVALTPIYHDQSQPLERRASAKALMTHIYRWGYFTRRKVSSGIALTDQNQEGTLES